MEKDFLVDLKYLGITARLKRINDTISASIKEMYKIEGTDIEPSWHLVFLILKKHKMLSMSEIAFAFNTSLPATFKMIDKMRKKGYVKIEKDKSDTRKKHVSLTKKSYKELPKLEKIWDAGQKSIEEILKNNKSFLTSLGKFENEIVRKGFNERVVEKLHK